MKSRVIFHIDVNSAYLSWEAVYGISVRKDEVDLREVPSIIGGDTRQEKGNTHSGDCP